MNLKIDAELRAHFPDLNVLTHHIEGVHVQKKSTELEKLKIELIGQIKDEYSLDSVKDQPIFRAYRDFFWSIKIDPTKTRPASEALIRRIIIGKPLPHVNTLVDSYNLASIKSRIALATFDADKLNGNLLMRFADEGEHFLGIGMQAPIIMKGLEIVVSDEEKVVAVYPYRDADNTKITERTENIVMVVCGVPGISKRDLWNASQVALDYIKRFCGGEKRV